MSVSMMYVYSIGSICRQYAWWTKQSYKEKKVEKYEKEICPCNESHLDTPAYGAIAAEKCRLTITYSADTPAYRATTAENMAVADDYADTPAYRGTAAENMFVANDSAIKRFCVK